jgi:hypothetical protein
MNEKLIQLAHKAALLSTQIQVAGLVEEGFVPPEYAAEECLHIMETGPLAKVETAHNLLGNRLTDTLMTGLLLQDALHAIVEEEIAAESDDDEAEPLPDHMEEMLDGLKQMIEGVKSLSSEVADLFEEIEETHRRDEHYSDPAYDDFDFEDALSKCSETYRQMHILGYIDDLTKAQNAATGIDINEYSNIPMDDMSLELYFEEFEAAQPLPAEMNSSFARAFNAVAQSHDFGRCIMPTADGKHTLGLIAATGGSEKYNWTRRPSRGGGGFGM